jgi:uncharacterized membrane protein YbjE (DUF340 family)
MDFANMFDIATISAIVAALVTVIGNAFGVQKEYRALMAVAFAVLLTMAVPPDWLDRLLTALIIGLTASGVYSQVKPSDSTINLMESFKRLRNKNKDSSQEEVQHKRAEDDDI